MAPPTPPSSPPSSAGVAASDLRPVTEPPAILNPLATPFSPTFIDGMAAEELPEWLLFSPSSSEGRSGRPSSVSPATSFIDVIRRPESSVLRGEGSSSGAHAHRFVGRSAAPSSLGGDFRVAHHEGKALVEEAGSVAPQGCLAVAPSGFMADA
jgi:hypothetical protein